MGNKNLGTFILIATIVAQATWVRAADDVEQDNSKYHLKAQEGIRHRVGDEKGWTLGVDYQAWVDSKNIRAGEIVEFNFDPTKHNIVTLGPKEWEGCIFDDAQRNNKPCGCTWYYLGGPGEQYYWASAFGNDCKEGMRIKLTVKP